MTILNVNGMRCQHCVQSVTKALNDLDGITNVSVNLEKNEVSFEETAPIDLEVVKQAIRDTGFDVA